MNASLKQKLILKIYNNVFVSKILFFLHCLIIKYLFSTYKNEINKNVVSEKLEGNNILIIAPHIDDEAIGCAGAILKGEDQQFHIAYVTDSFGTDYAEKVYGITPKQLRDTRISEAETFASRCNIPLGNLHYIDSVEYKVLESVDFVADKLLNIIREIKPDAICMPNAFDYHIDHFAITEVLKSVYVTNKDLGNLVLYLYEVQSPLTPIYSNFAIDISEVYQKKLELLSIYKSQNSNCFLSSLNDGYKINSKAFENKHVEIYLKTTLEKYITFCNENNIDAAYFEKDISKLKPNWRSLLTLLPSFISSIKIKKPLLKLR